MTEIRRKLYKRGSSFETTVPIPMLFGLDLTSKYHVSFVFDESTHRWYIEFEERKEEDDKKEI